MNMQIPEIKPPAPPPDVSTTEASSEEYVTPNNQHERIPSNWNITETEEGTLLVRNIVTGRTLEFERPEFKKFLRS